MKKYRHLSREERYQIYGALQNGASITEISKQLGRSPSTISRELKRNRGKKGYRPKQASEFAQKRCQEANARNVNKIPKQLMDKAIEKLKNEQWSPEQISGRFAADKVGSISYETIYRYIIADKHSGGSLYLNLRRHNRTYKHRTGSTNTRGMIKNRRDIDTRPACVANRKQVGHWEADTVVGKQTRGNVLVTLVERKSLFTLTAKAIDKTAESVSAVICKLLEPYSSCVKTITFDNGKEFAFHETIDQCIGCISYFAHPYHSWERGTNENTNGLLRQYFPKGKSMDNLDSDFILSIQNRLNNRPRKKLGWRTPAEVFLESFKHRSTVSTN